MNLFYSDKQLIVFLRSLVCHHLSVNISKNFSFSSINQSFVKKEFNLKLNQRLNDLKPKPKQTFVRNDKNIGLNTRIQSNKRRTEETINFDHRFSDTFGNLSGYDKKLKRLSAEDLPEDDDNYDVLEIKRGPKMAEIGYRKQLNELINKKPIQMRKALELYNKMVSEDRIPPDRCTYTLLINGCAKVGYTEKAFLLFQELLKYELRPTQPAITALFNACAECPFPEFGLEKARYLKEWMSLEGVVANTVHYNSMIKAFGKLGDIRTAFGIIEEMVANGQSATDETFAMLLMACISNKESGLYDAIQVFRQMKINNRIQTIYSYNLLLRAIRDCRIGSEHNLNSIVAKSSLRSQHIKSKSVSNNKNRNDVNKTETNSFDPTVPESSVDSNTKSLIVKIPNLLLENSLNETNIIKIDFNSLSSASNRLMLFGGIEGFIQMMTDSNVRPNIKTLTLLAELVDLRQESEEVILDLLHRFDIKAETDFFNILIKKICFERGVIGAKTALSAMTAKGLQPNIMTFGVLSVGCRSFALGKQLLFDMEGLGIRPNHPIMGALVSNACHSKNFRYINYILDYMKDNDLKADHKMVEKLQLIQMQFQTILSNYDWNKNTSIDHRFNCEHFRKEFALFKHKYQRIQRMAIQEEDHPWHQFQFQEIPNKEGMHSFVKFMKQKIQKRRGLTDRTELDEYEEDELYND